MCHETRTWQENRTAHGLLGLFILTCFVSCRKFTCSYSPASYPSADGELAYLHPPASGRRGAGSALHFEWGDFTSAPVSLNPPRSRSPVNAGP